jgi:hypothetical protein
VQEARVKGVPFVAGRARSTPRAPGQRAASCASAAGTSASAPAPPPEAGAPPLLIAVPGFPLFVSRRAASTRAARRAALRRTPRRAC